MCVKKMITSRPNSWNRDEKLLGLSNVCLRAALDGTTPSRKAFVKSTTRSSSCKWNLSIGYDCRVRNKNVPEFWHVPFVFSFAKRFVFFFPDFEFFCSLLRCFVSLIFCVAFSFRVCVIPCFPVCVRICDLSHDLGLLDGQPSFPSPPPLAFPAISHWSLRVKFVSAILARVQEKIVENWVYRGFKGLFLVLKRLVRLMLHAWCDTWAKLL